MRDFVISAGAGRLAVRTVLLALVAALGWLGSASAGEVAEAAERWTPAIAQGYLYLEPLEARVEVLFDLPSMLERLGTPAKAGEFFSAADQERTRAAVAKTAHDWCHVRSDGEAATGSFIGASFIGGQPGSTQPVNPQVNMLPKELMVGLVWVFDIGAAPSHVEVQWSGFEGGFEHLPLTVFAGRSTQELQIAKPLSFARWNNDAGRLPKPRPLAEVPSIPAVRSYDVPVAMLAWLLLGAAIYTWMTVKRFKFPGGFVPFLAAWGIGLVITYHLGVVAVRDPFAPRTPGITKADKAEEVLLPLLKNVYRAFDYRKESDVYDRLARSVDGELLRTLYLQTIQALTLEGQEGTRVKISELSVEVSKVTPGPDGGFVAEGEWTVLGTVGHWGHEHQRANRYKARLTVVPVNGEWKIQAMEVLDERRIG